VWSGNAAGVVLFISVLTFWLGNVVEVATTPGTGAVEKGKAIGKATGAALLGLIIFFTLFAAFGL
jgi:hypothetical protein